METIDEVLQHFGVKGQRWGVRRRSSSSDSADHLRTKHLRKKRVSQLSNEELQDLARRLNLESQILNLNPPKSKIATKFVTDVLVSVGKQQATKIAGDIATKQIAKILASAVKG